MGLMVEEVNEVEEVYERLSDIHCSSLLLFRYSIMFYTLF